jgi:L-alanine-DL-glutamate epimerase-like enolase superfamily enzyme
LRPTLKITATVERWPVAGSFIIARGAKTHVDVIVVEISDGTHAGRGEATPIYYKGETAESAVAAIAALGRYIDPEAIQSLLPAGAARNALDYAFWDLAAQRQGKPVWQLAGLPPPQPLATAMTVSLGTPEKMEADARTLAGQFSLLKLKLSGEGDVERVEAVRRGAPNARLIVDANESWTGRDVAAEAAALIPYGVELIEQPVKAGEDHLLDGVVPLIPLAADESCQDRADLARCMGRYGAINIKLDKAGGLTEALALKSEAQAMGFDIMVGCMLSTSLGLAPAFLVAQGVRWVDLDGALLLAKDREAGFKVEGGVIMPPSNLI